MVFGMNSSDTAALETFLLGVAAITLTPLMAGLNILCVYQGIFLSYFPVTEDLCCREIWKIWECCP